MNRGKRYKKRKTVLSRIVVALVILSAICIGGAVGINGVRYLSFLNSNNINNNIKEPQTSETIKLTPSPASDNHATTQTPQPEMPLITIPLENLPSQYKAFSYQVLVDRKPVNEFKRAYDIKFPASADYSKLEGVTSFRGNNYRDSASYGYADVRLQKLEKVWFVKNGRIDIWTGVGWTGQPAIVKWTDEVKNIMNIVPEKKKKTDLKEVIYATLDGNIYFLDLDDGKPTRPPINVGSPHKGSVAVDPRGYPLLFAGQGIPEVAGKKIPIGYRIFDLINQKQLYFLDGMDPDKYRYWGAFDSGALIDAKTDTFIECGENGILYSGKLNTSFQPDKKTISVRPELVKYRYHSPISSKIGTENSPVVYKNYIYFADNSGLFQCVDLNTLKPVWIRDVIDDTDSSTVLEETDSGVYLYTANEVDHHQNKGASYIKKLNALTGELIWEKKVPCFYDSHTNGGALATPVLGKHDISDLVIYNIAKTDMKNNGSTLIALDRKTGEEKWKVSMKFYSWSSPVAIYTKEGKSYLILSDSGGYMNLFEGATGKKLDSLPLEANVEGSPAVYDDMIVVGTRGSKIWGIRIK